jgi:pyruvate dehydrogenase E1 component alpha subunit
MSNMVLTKESGTHFLHEMIRIRRFEEKCAELYSAGKIRGFLHLGIGQEAVAVGVMEALRAHDAITATYREHGHALARGVSMQKLMAEMFGKAEGCSRGRGGSMHLFDKETGFYGGHAIVAGGIPVAVGLGLAEQALGKTGISVCFFGEGATAEGEFHEALNLAALWKVPVLFVCENNGYAMGTALERFESQTNLCQHAKSYGVPAESVDGMDIMAVNEATRRLVDVCQSGPQFLECRTYRFRGHSMFDSESYRTSSEVESWKLRGPIRSLSEHLVSEGLLRKGEREEIEERVASEIADAVAFAEAADIEPVEDLERDVYSPRGQA